ncbi:hypothetical protein F6R98_10660 [Candidatus Methylospira mobilis]|uniref:Uncharacterized protein n=1 Tax=Candidatus Methylospira mobilis TaxID=1808979 RepID=A0A5Q0BHJ1_9GAMM|nr:hypothetical protein [Candidatus Methylospira mobilis]QFY43019.1 hypothetical protein F6R98_10660 [Candidatus Methylospira mobilis]
MNWKADIVRVVTGIEELASAQDEAAIRESERRKVFNEQRDHALFVLRNGANEFCREARVTGIDAFVKTEEDGFSVTANIRNASVKLFVLGRASSQDWHVFYTASIKPQAGRKIDLPATFIQVFDEVTIPELMTKLLDKTL